MEPIVGDVTEEDVDSEDIGTLLTSFERFDDSLAELEEHERFSV